MAYYRFVYGEDEQLGEVHSSAFNAIAEIGQIMSRLSQGIEPEHIGHVKIKLLFSNEPEGLHPGCIVEGDGDFVSERVRVKK